MNSKAQLKPTLESLGYASPASVLIVALKNCTMDETKTALDAVGYSSLQLKELAAFLDKLSLANVGR